MVYFDRILHMYACQHCLTAGMHNSFFDGQGFPEHQFHKSWSISEIVITTEPHGVFGSNFAFLFILTLSSHLYAKRWRGCCENFNFKKLPKITSSILTKYPNRNYQ